MSSPKPSLPQASLLVAIGCCLCCLCCCCLVEAATSSPQLGGSSSSSRRIRFASFNIQVFGRKKASDVSVMDTLARILRRYDIVVVMEIRDSSGESFTKLVSHTNRYLGSDPFDYVISERTGRTVSKEQYAVLYRHSVASVLTELTVPDPGDRFQREPYLVALGLKRSQEAAAGGGGRRRSTAGTADPVPLTLLCLHTDPEETVAELNALRDVARPLRSGNLLIAGDLNADCSYVSRSAMAGLQLRHDPDFHWLIGDGVDTTVKSTDCAYDRLIASNSTLRLLSPPARVFRFDQEFGLGPAEAAKVSDHYPVEVDIRL